jgi:acetyl-CoA C-acetyltransferase
MSREVVVVSGVRTAIGGFGGSLAATSPGELGALTVREAMNRAGIREGETEHVVFGNVHQTAPEDMYLARVAAVNGGAGVQAAGLTLNRLCASGLQAIVTAAQYIQTGDADISIAGGAEVMSRTPHIMQALRGGQRMGDTVVVDMLTGGLTDPFNRTLMGEIAERMARDGGISRSEQDEYALASHRRAALAQAEGRFASQIVPVPVPVRGKSATTRFDVDEHIKVDASLEDFARMRPVFAKEGGTVTAGNASGINDAAAAVVLMAGDVALSRGVRPLGRLVAYAHAGVEPLEMGFGPVPATRRVLEKAGLATGDIDVIELNEAYAVQNIAVIRALDLPSGKVNPNGSGISLGHPVGATGAIMVIKALAELERIDGRFGLVTLCIGGGQGMAVIVERMG